MVPRNTSRTSSCTSASHSSSSMRSIFVSATTPRRTRSKSRIARCSRVCGITASSAATTSIARSIPPTPASMFLMKSSCPGTSTMLTSSPLGSVIHAKPKSIVIWRAFSSFSRSGSMPVRACTSVDLPWSTCPAVPMTRIGAQALFVCSRTASLMRWKWRRISSNCAEAISSWNAHNSVMSARYSV